MTQQRGLDNILSGGTNYLAFEDGKPQDLLILDWYEDLIAVREHYEASLNPRYVRCPGKDVCPLCKANPDKFPSLKVKFRAYDPNEDKVKVGSLAKKHIKSLNQDFNLDEVDPTQAFVKIHRTGKTANDTSYSARTAKGDYTMPNLDDLDVPDLEELTQPHTPEQVQGFMDALLNSGADESQGTSQDNGQTESGNNQNADQGGNTGGGNSGGAGKKLPF